MKHKRNPPPLFFLFRAIGTICIFIVCLCIMWMLSGCTMVPYWKDQPGQPLPSPTEQGASAAPIPIGWKEYVTVGTVNIRVDPDTSSQTIGWLLAGVSIRADCDRSDGFCEVPGGYVIKGCLVKDQGSCSSK